ncbi:extracellular solute-binding protein, family 5 [Desulforamulus reducens MI-1]|uniref:Extracellular solute-binding protein, family 5 n=1 Tax=Desulforamulus reducens (strain ATCC BAA-1160 / DSM 100696 / MI-1) TaxID=349161 RepID=A4J1S7_DESRM|nr:ABC transporter substrate-binding protein [Desulforamulus reducens]ABO49030.1 extracellular solute-binding protein, family 5 [Desulforamulus reducens MI-1]
MKNKLFQLAFLFLFLSFFSVVVNYDKGASPTFFKKEIPQQIDITYALAEPLKSLDPAEANNMSEAKVLSNIFEGLVRYQSGTSEIEPCLATHWELSKDGCSWVFHLRKNVTFHDGTPFNAQAVKISIERQLPPQKKDTMSYGSFTFGMLKKIEVIDNYTINFLLTTPYSPFLRNLAMPWAAPIISPSSLKNLGNDKMLLAGTGPFYLADWRNGAPILLANEKYWDKKPFIKSLSFLPQSPQQRLASLNKGTVEMADVSGLPGDTIKAQNVITTSQSSASLSYLGMFNNRPPFNNDKVRRALCMAIDTRELTKNIFGDQSLAANSILPPEILGYNKNLRPYFGGPEKAKALLSQYGYTEGLDITLITYNTPRPYNPLGGTELATTIKKQLAKAGIRVNVKVYPWHEFKSALRKQEGDAFLFGWVSDNLDPDNFLYTLLASDEITKTNLTHYKNSEVDRLISAAQREQDEKIRKRLYYHAQQIMLQDTPMVFLNYGQDKIALTKNIQNLKLNPFGIPLFAKAYIQ